MIDPVLQFLYQWTLKTPLASVQSDGCGGVKYNYRSNKITAAQTTSEIWAINLYRGDGYSIADGYIESNLVNCFVNKYSI